MLALLTAPSAAVRLLPKAPALLAQASARAAAPAIGAAAGALAGTARAGVRGADSAARVVRVARNALPGARGHWRSGARAHLALRAADPEQVRRPAAGSTWRAGWPPPSPSGPTCSSRTGTRGWRGWSSP